MGLQLRNKTTNQLMCADILSQVPYLDAPSLIARYQFALIWMDNGIVDRRFVLVIPLDFGCSAD